MRHATARTRDEVQTRDGLPCVNVKVYASVTRKVLDAVERDTGMPGFADWAQAKLDADAWPEWAWESAIENGWECLETDAEQAFQGYAVKLHAEGRSGGWCVVKGLPDIDSWDAIMLGRWRRFEKWARQQADGIPYGMADALAMNDYYHVLNLPVCP